MSNLEDPMIGLLEKELSADNIWNYLSEICKNLADKHKHVSAHQNYVPIAGQIVCAVLTQQQRETAGRELDKAISLIHSAAGRLSVETV